MKKYYWMMMCAAIVIVVFLAQNDTRCLKPINIGCRVAREVIQKAKIGDGEFSLRVARTEWERSRGLGGMPALAQNEGMLFEFSRDDFYAIWMKGMLIPIDIIWFSDGFLVVDIRERVSPDSFPAVFVPKSPARFVVELPAGSAEAFGISIGSRAELFAQ